jgi:hypothetical protein
VASTDSDELVRLCHRVLVVQQGRIVRTLRRDHDLTVDELNHAQLARTGGITGTDGTDGINGTNGTTGGDRP